MRRSTSLAQLASLALLLIAGCAEPPAPEPSESPADSASAPAVSFTDVTEEAGSGSFRHTTGAFGEKWFPETMGSGGGFIDYDGDGDLDVLITESGGGVHLWRNNLIQKTPPAAEAPNYLRVKLTGRESNRDGIGARVVAVTEGERQTRLVQERLVHTGSSYLSQSELAVTFGLGAAEQVDTLRVQWPSGQVSRLTDVRADQTVHIVEGTQAGGPPIAASAKKHQ